MGMRRQNPPQTMRNGNRYHGYGKFECHANERQFATTSCATEFGRSGFALHNAKDAREPAANSHVMGTDTANCGCSRFAFRGAIKVRGQFACHGNRYRMRRSWTKNENPLPQIVDATNLPFTMQETRMINSSAT